MNIAGSRAPLIGPGSGSDTLTTVLDPSKTQLSVETPQTVTTDHDEVRKHTTHKTILSPPMTEEVG